MGLIPGSQVKTKSPVQTGVIQEWDEDRNTGEAYWAVYYKTVKFGDFDHLDVASERLQQLIELDSTPPLTKKPAAPTVNIKG